MNPPAPDRTGRRFSLRKCVWTLLGVGLVAFAALVVYANVVQARLCAAECGAIAMLKTYARAQTLFQREELGRNIGRWGYSDPTAGRAGNRSAYDAENRGFAVHWSDLHNIPTSESDRRPRALISAAMAAADDPERAFNGYFLIQGLVDGQPARPFPGLFATPARYGETGYNTFYIDGEGVVRYIDLNRSMTRADIQKLNPGDKNVWQDA